MPKKAAKNVVKKATKDETKNILVTKEGFKKLKDELDYLENIKRREVAARIKEAVSYGDLSENSEYEEAKNEQAFVEGRIIVLTEQIKYAKIIEQKSSKDKTSKADKIVQVGNTVKIKTLSGKLEGEVLEYSIVGTTEADPLNGKISNESPVGSSLLDKKKGEKVEVKAPIGIVEYEILEIS
ncbi:transcription elongation factor GreA [Candidatus Peregrinibacteria bacterium]|nr:transcription elongation factor GreA [Candidatus Peregrinibacteria bacterium]